MLLSCPWIGPFLGWTTWCYRALPVVIHVAEVNKNYQFNLREKINSFVFFARPIALKIKCATEVWTAWFGLFQFRFVAVPMVFMEFAIFYGIIECLE